MPIPQFFTGMSPLIVDGICLAHVGTKDKGEVLALDIKTGNEKWKWSGDRTGSCLAISNDLKRTKAYYCADRKEPDGLEFCGW